jgi:hypothetical protein
MDTKDPTPPHSSQNITEPNPEIEILKMEYERLYGLFQHSEDFGEKRTNLMITITGFLFAGFFAFLKDDSNYFFKNSFVFWLLVMAIIFLLILGCLTLIRMANRNINTDEYKEGIRLIKEYFRSRYADLNNYLFFDTLKELEPRKTRKSRGGFIEVIRLINSVLFGLLIYMLLNYIDYNNFLQFLPMRIILLISILAAIFLWVIQNVFVGLIYDEWWKAYLKEMGNKKKPL